MSFVLGLFAGTVLGFIAFCAVSTGSSEDAFAEGYRKGLVQAKVDQRKELVLNDESRS